MLAMGIVMEMMMVTATVTEKDMDRVMDIATKMDTVIVTETETKMRR